MDISSQAGPEIARGPNYTLHKPSCGVLGPKFNAASSLIPSSGSANSPDLRQNALEGKNNRFNSDLVGTDLKFFPCYGLNLGLGLVAGQQDD